MIDTASQRIENARKAAGIRSARQAAIALRMPYPTYVNYEKGLRGIDFPIAERLARLFKVDPVWLLTGKGQPRAALPGIPVVGRVGAGAAIEPVFDDAYAAGAERLELPDPAHLAIAIVSGDSQLPRYRDGEAILFDIRGQLPEDVVNQYAIVDLADGRRMIKIVRRTNGNFWLESHNAEHEMDVKIIAAFRVEGSLTGYASRSFLPGRPGNLRRKS
jgi:hypothetical protein